MAHPNARAAVARGATSAAVLTLVLAMTISTLAAAGAPPPTTVLHPPYKGAYTGYQNVQTTQCAKAKFLAPTSFSMKTGKGGLGSSATSAKYCGTGFANTGSYFQGYVDPQLDLAIGAPLPGGSHSVQLSLDLVATISGHIAPLGKCPAAKPYSSGFSFSGGSGTTYYYNQSGVQSVCTVEASAFVYLEEAVLADLTNGSTTYMSGCSSTFCFNTLLDNYTYATNESGYYRDSDTTCTSSSGCSTTWYNGSLNYTYAPPSLSYSGTDTISTTLYFNGTFAKAHHYAIELDFIGSSGSDVEGYPRGSAATTMNIETLGNGLDIPVITVV